jgi:beta-lactamase regulating signal transducer with metallopeptidase domain
MNPFIISLAIRLTVLLIAGGLIAIAVHRSTHAVRHIVIAATLACVVALPAMMVLVPEWRVGVLPSVQPLDALFTAVPTVAPLRTTPAAAAPRSRESIHPVLVTSQVEPAASSARVAAALPAERPSFAAPHFSMTVPQIALAIWLVGVAIGLLWIAAGRFGLARVRRRATPLTSFEWRTILETEAMHAGVARHVALLTSPAVSMPVTWGVLSPVIVLPEASEEWTHERKRVVVMHEMAHIARRDSATQLLATLACVAYWIHPLVLIAARRLKAECERACDERVLERGTPAADYAAHLLEVARLSRSFGAASIVSVAMARPSQLEGRLLAVLRAKPRRAQISPRTRILATISAAAMLLAVSAFRPVAREAHARSAKPAVTSRLRVSATPSAASSAEHSVAQSRAIHVTATATATNSAISTATESATSTAAVAPVIANTNTNSATPDSVFQKTVTVHPGGTLTLDLDTGGEVEITGTDESTVSVTGSLGGRDWRETLVNLGETNGDARLESRYEGSSSRMSFENSFTIHVPKHFNVRLTSSGGSVSINGVEGRFTGSTGGGKIAIDHTTGEAELSTGGGDIRVSNSHLDGSVSTGGGQVRFENVTGGIAPSSGSYGFRSFGSNFSSPEEFELLSSSDTDEASMRRSRVAMDRARATMKRAQITMERSRGTMERQGFKFRDSSKFRDGYKFRDSSSMMDDSAEMERDGIKMKHGFSMSFDDGAMAESDSAMDHGREKFERMRKRMMRDRGDMDSANIIIERNRGSMDQGEALELNLEPMRKSLESMKKMKLDLGGLQDVERLSQLDKFIVIDKDGGAIRLLRAPNGARLSTGGGAIVVGRAHGAVLANTGAGDISIAEADAAAHATTGAGNVMITTVGDAAHPVDVSSGSGNVELVLPKGANATLDLETAYTENFGKHTKIKSDWPLNVTETQDWDDSQGTPRKYVRVRQNIGKGGPVIRVRTVNGDIKLKQGS